MVESWNWLRIGREGVWAGPWCHGSTPRSLLHRQSFIWIQIQLITQLMIWNIWLHIFCPTEMSRQLNHLLFFEVYLWLANYTGGCGWGLERSSSNLKVGSLIPSLPHLHAEVSLSKMLNPELPSIEQERAANRCTVWMCVWLGECKTVKSFESSGLEKTRSLENTKPFTLCVNTVNSVKRNWFWNGFTWLHPGGKEETSVSVLFSPFPSKNQLHRCCSF